MHAQIHRGEVGCAGLCLLPIRLNRFSTLSPGVNLVGKVEGEYKIVVGGASQGETCRTVSRYERASGRWSGRHCRKIISPIVAKDGSCLLILRRGSFQVLVRNIDLKFQRIELRILKNSPPRTTKILVVRLGGFPIP